MSIKHRKIVLAVILMICNIVTIAGMIHLNKYHGEYVYLFELFKFISFCILSFVAVVYLLHYIVVNIAKVKLKNSYYDMDVEQRQDILYQWNRKKDTIVYSANIYKKYSIEMIRKDFMKSVINSKNILDEHKEDLVNVMNKLINGSSYEQVEVKLKRIDGSFSWVRISGTAILNINGELSKIVGVVSDIDEEKRKNEELVFKAERDSLTKIYNRGKFIELVNDYLSEAGKDKKSYLIIIDIDNFKDINNNLGHIYGDKALINLSSNLKRILNANEFVGRIGGDELCIFIEGSYEVDYILKRADEIMNVIINTKVDEKVNVSASIGISQYPKDGLSFEELYIKSDEAMYKAKKKGKGRYIIYDLE